MPYALNFSRSNLFKVAPDKEDAFQQWAQDLGLGVTSYDDNGEKLFGIWPQETDEGNWPYPPDEVDEDAICYDEDPQLNVVYGLAQFLREGSVAVIIVVGADFSAGDTVDVGASAFAVNSKGEYFEWNLTDIMETASCLGSECEGFAWRASTEGIDE